MKTNQIMIRQDLVEQRTFDSFFNATKTVKIWNLENPSKQKSVYEFMRLNGTIDYIEHLRTTEGIEPYKSSNKGTWMHPMLYVDFCMWISIEFKTMAIKYVLDGLIKSRHDAGDFYNQMMAIILEKYVENHGSKPNPRIYIIEANLIKQVAEIDKERNEMTEQELNMITHLQRMNAQMIKDEVSFETRKKNLTILKKSFYL